MIMNRFEITSNYGQIKLGHLRAHWYNAEDEYPGFFLLSWKRYNLEFGQIDQKRPGIYLTRYVNHDVEPLRTIAQF